MKKINYTFECLWGIYNFDCEFDLDNVVYSVNSSINDSFEKQGDLSKEDVKKFNELIDKARIDTWQEEYEDLNIEDKTTWKIVYIDEDKEYKSHGYEGSWPYNYQCLIDAMKLCDIDTSIMDIQEDI